MGFIAIAVPCVLLVLASGPADEDTSLPAILVLVTFASAVLAPAMWYSFRVLPLWMTHVLALVCDATVAGACFAAGVRYSPLAAALAWVVLGTVIFVIGQRRVAFAHLVPIALAYGFVVLVQDGNSAPAGRWMAVMGIVTLTGVTVSNLMERTKHLAVAERAALDAAHAAQAELEELNRSLETRVGSQVDELERLRQLRRFLPRPVADALVSGEGMELLEPHRRQIAVFVCDLRGLSGFTGSAEPEDVADALEEFYRVVGEVVRRYEATVGTFAGDGVMAYLNDPVPCDDPAGRALSMARDLRIPLHELTNTWRRRGHDLGFGTGIAFGYATLGMIGVEERNDYTAVGPVVQLATRLCAEARDGEIFVDQRALVAAGEGPDAEPIEITLRGHVEPVAAFRLTG